MESPSFIAIGMFGVVLLCATLALGYAFARMAGLIHRAGGENTVTPADFQRQRPVPAEILSRALSGVTVDQLRAFAPSCSADEIAALLSVLPLEMSNEVVKTAGKEALLAATELLDDDWAVSEDTAQALAKRFGSSPGGAVASGDV